MSFMNNGFLTDNLLLFQSIEKEDSRVESVKKFGCGASRDNNRLPCIFNRKQVLVCHY